MVLPGDLSSRCSEKCQPGLDVGVELRSNIGHRAADATFVGRFFRRRCPNGTNGDGGRIDGHIRRPS